MILAGLEFKAILCFHSLSSGIASMLPAWLAIGLFSIFNYMCLYIMCAPPMVVFGEQRASFMIDDIYTHMHIFFKLQTQLWVLLLSGLAGMFHTQGHVPVHTGTFISSFLTWMSHCPGQNSGLVWVDSENRYLVLCPARWIVPGLTTHHKVCCGWSWDFSPFIAFICSRQWIWDDRPTL